jgi:uncharacterized protein (UPF0264 family)
MQMKLLVSVSDGAEAAAALAGGADIIDAKDPANGALGAVSLDVFRDIVTAVDGERLVTAALGDATDEASIEPLVRAYSASGARLVKIGFAGVSSHDRVRALLDAATRGAELRAAVIAVAYADAARANSPDPNVVLDAAAQTGVAGVLLDTADKDGPGLRGLIGPLALHAWIVAAREAGLLVALAGKLSADDLEFVREAGADIAGVRGAACDNGRTGRIVAEKVRLLRSADRRSARAPAPDPAAAS